MTTHSEEAGELYHAHWSPEYQTFVRRMAERQRRAVIGERNRAETIKRLQSDFAKLTYEQRWDIENEEHYDPAIFRAIQQETE